ncbi:MAG: chemotaxis protein CheW [Candidatus Goldiibacteriota bacterium]
MAETVKAAEGGKYLTFKISQEEYGLEILKVKEIIGIMPVTSVPRTPEFVRGVINLRGRVIPVVELRSKFSMQVIDDTGETCIIVVEIDKDGKPLQIGILVDSVSEVLDITEKEIEATPSFGTEIDTQFILGMAKTKDGVKILLNIEKVLTEKELVEMAKTKCTFMEEDKKKDKEKTEE